MDKTSTGRLARWALKLQEFDFWVKYRKGEEQGNADFLSRVREQEDGSYLVFTLTEQYCSYEVLILDQDPSLAEQSPDKKTAWVKIKMQPPPQPAPKMPEGMQQQTQCEDPIISILVSKKEHKPVGVQFKQKLVLAQQQDEWCRQIRAVLEGDEIGQPPHIVRWVQANVIVELDGVLLKSAYLSTSTETKMKKVTQILLPRSLREEVMEMVHTHPVHGHRGITSTYRVIRDCYFWPTMHSDMKEHIARCDTCQKRRSVRNPVPHHVRDLPPKCFQNVFIDFAGPFGKNVGGSFPKYCLVIVDHLSRYPILIPCKNTKSETVIQALKSRLYPDYGVPEVIVLDQQSSFTGHVMDSHCLTYGIELDVVAPGNHKANGMAERMIRELNDRMAVKGEQEWKKWHHHIKDIEMSLRVTPSDDTGLSPAEMYLGKQLRTGIAPTFHEASMEEDNLVDSAQRNYNLRARKIKQKTETDAPEKSYGLKERIFKKGELVRVYTDRSMASKSEDMPRRWKNKYGIKASIIEILERDQYLLRNVETGKTIKRSGAQITKIPQF
jgi:transposase InsO family protein